MKETGELTFVVFSSVMVQEALQELTPFLTAHRRRWPGAYKAPHFHENVVLQGLASGVLHFSALRLKGRTVAWHLGFTYRDRFYYYMPAYEKEFEHFSPGKILLLKCAEDAIARKLTVFDYLRGEENYKAEWTDQRAYLSSFQFDNPSLQCRFRNFAVDCIKRGSSAIIMYDAAYQVWKEYKKKHIGRHEALEIIGDQYGVRSFFLLYPFYKTVKPFRKLKKWVMCRKLGERE